MNTALTVISLISGVITLFFLVYKPLNNSAVALRENSLANENLSKTLEEFKQEFREYRAEEKEEIEKLWAHNRKQDQKITDHNLHIRIIEERTGIHGNERD